MITFENHLGIINITHSYLASLIGNTATSCFGVVAMNTSGSRQTIMSIFKKYNPIDKGVSIRYNKNMLDINLHITVALGTNISAIAESIAHKLRYVVMEETGIHVSEANVFIDALAV